MIAQLFPCTQTPPFGVISILAWFGTFCLNHTGRQGHSPTSAACACLLSGLCLPLPLSVHKNSIMQGLLPSTYTVMDATWCSPQAILPQGCVPFHSLALFAGVALGGFCACAKTKCFLKQLSYGTAKSTALGLPIRSSDSRITVCFNYTNQLCILSCFVLTDFIQFQRESSMFWTAGEDATP